MSYIETFNYLKNKASLIHQVLIPFKGILNKSIKVIIDL